MPYIPDFMRIPLATAFFVALSLSLCSFFVVLKRWAFLSVGVSHAAFGGVALGFLLGVNPTATALAFSLIAAFIIAFAKRKGGMHEDITIGVIFSFFMAVGVILFSFSKRYIANAFSYLFGNLLAVEELDLLLAVFVFLLVFGFLILFRRQLLLTLLDEDLAYVSGVRVNVVYYALVFLVTLSIIVSIKCVGVVLVSALAVVPGSLALKLSSKLMGILALSVLIGLFSTVLGVFLSVTFDLPPGAAVSVVLSVLFFGSVLKKI